MMQIKFNFNKFVFYGVIVCHSLTACHRHTPSSLAALAGPPVVQ